MSAKALKILTVYKTHNFQNNHMVTTIENEQATAALLKFMVLMALFLLTSRANAFTSVSLADGQVQINHLIHLQKPEMSHLWTLNKTTSAQSGH